MAIKQVSNYIRSYPIFALCLIWLSAAVNAQAAVFASGSTVYQGSIGKQPVIAELVANGDEFKLRFSRSPREPDIKMQGRQQDDELHLRNESERLEMVLKHDDLNQKELIGSVKLDDNRFQLIKLQPAEIAEFDPAQSTYLAALREAQPYQFLRLQQVKLQKDKVTTFQKHHLQWWLEPNSKLRLFEVLDGYDPEVLIQINQELRNAFWQNVHKQIRRGLQAEVKQKIYPTYFSDKAISVYSSVQPINLRIVNGQVDQLSLDDIVWLDDKVQLLSAQFDGTTFKKQYKMTVMLYHEQKLAPWLAEQARKRPLPKKRHSDICLEDVTADYSWFDASHWYLTTKGVVVEPDAEGCRTLFHLLLSYPLIAQHTGWFKLSGN